MHVLTPVVILPCGLGHNSICLMRSLGRLGVPVYSVESVSGAFASRSRYCKGRFSCKDNQPELVHRLLEIGRRIGQRSVLITTTDEAAMFLGHNADALKDWFIFPRVDPRLLHSLCSKKELYYLAKRLKIPTPGAVFPSSRSDVLEFLQAAEFPIMLKGIDGHRLAKRAGKRMFIARTRAELLDRYDSIEECGNPNMMLQEYIPGDDDAVCGLEGYFDESSDCMFAVTGKKLRQWPAYKGVTTLGICQKNETIEKMTKEFAKSIGYRGILDIGFRYDSRDGQYKLLDANPRVGCTFRLFVSENNIDVARALYLDLTGQPVSRVSAQEGRKWIVEDLDILSSIRYLLDRKLTIKQWLTSFRGIQETAYFATDDPLPFLAMWLSRGTELLKRAYYKLTGRDVRQLRQTYSAGRGA